MLILTCDITQTNDLFVYVKQRIENIYLKNKGVSIQKTPIHCIKITLRET
ncbi:hypothetical protein HMPREF1411_01533 [Helicobacter pylori GAM250AFi]|nr:hypothetical protein HMPREF1404_00444 [Helicobacter pylori GAM210Bi]EMH07730.1 hypothetical protein HMPREF1411_01533 [Helicobacter pylori GAM250AFi]EMH12674.1 hypothetical protein HMPREF1414_01421 [Helicobacter pylori GAM252T]EMH12843.1 hypothetical protein HMPREF1413_01454 [Helicobacter pylori GAM252Bi]EMH34733.1 hypothetical protein HMPREF1426_00883 [Helicobacter pylori GAM80Ai]EMH46455.1 hypothetical protein HMPREF1438_01234 [Helicobacter pylori HP250AFii]EMH46833.1 hypothetical protein